MKITLKNVKHAEFASEETHCYSASLYVDGKRIGVVSNDGHGGPDRFDGDRAAYAAADAWCTENLPPITFDDRSIPTDLECQCGHLVNQWLHAKDLKSALKRKVLFRKAGEAAIYEIPHRDRVADVVRQVAEKYPGATILNTLAEAEALEIYTTHAQ